MPSASSGSGRAPPRGCSRRRPRRRRTPPSSAAADLLRRARRPTCSRPTPPTSPGPSGDGVIADRRRPAAPDAGPRRGAWPAGCAQVAALADPVGEVARRLGAAERPAHPPGAGAARRRRRSSTRTGPTSPATPPGCASSRGNAAFLRGSSGAISSNLAIAAVLREGVAKAGLPADAVVLVEDTSREAAVEFMRLRGVDRLPHPAGRPVADRARSSSTPPCPT